MKCRMAALAVVSLVAACGAHVQTSSSSTAQLGRYHTFAFYSPPDRPQTAVDETIRSRLTAELESKGLAPAGTQRPDFLIGYHLGKREKLEQHTLGVGTDWGWGVPYDTVATERTLVIDFVDPTTRQIFWRGSAVGPAHHPSAGPNLDRLDKAVGKVADRYPGVMTADVRRSAL